ncbi:hypothetical protein [Paenibacillus sp. J2TS4]|uniref:hypothetical protein n=1 Tax=Paenibacillus sp. J2TS4 TaxID=2807194 RepID=UPI001B046EDD|nr:hypothetical protein [Paenibacillus sp. J2TS4]GIP34677.1 hypothetical protein J2TS4_38870 [Paenibacillus sp. J2TS4]
MNSEAKISLAQSYDADALRRSQSEVAKWKLAERQNFMNLLHSEQKQACWKSEREQARMRKLLAIRGIK